MCQYNGKREAGYNDHGGYEAAEVDWSCAIVVFREIVCAAVREESIWKGGENEYECDE